MQAVRAEEGLSLVLRRQRECRTDGSVDTVIRVSHHLVAAASTLAPFNALGANLLQLRAELDGLERDHLGFAQLDLRVGTANLEDDEEALATIADSA